MIAARSASCSWRSAGRCTTRCSASWAATATWKIWSRTRSSNLPGAAVVPRRQHADRWCQTIATRIAYLAISRRKPPSVDLALVEETVSSDVDTGRQVMLRDATRRLYGALERIEAKQRSRSRWP